MEVKIKKLSQDAILPRYATDASGCFDLFYKEDYEEEFDLVLEVSTGLSFEIPEGYVGYVFPRSSNSKYDLQLCNSVGIIDSGYRGEIKLRYRRIINPQPGRNFVVSDNNIPPIQWIKADFACYEIGDKVGQIMILPYPKVEFKEVEELSQTERGEGGFGSTGK